jgi:hypothetical protein
VWACVGNLKGRCRSPCQTPGVLAIDPAVFWSAASVIAVVAIAIVGGTYKVVTRHNDRRLADQENERAEKHKAPQAQAALDAHHQQFGAYLCPWAADHVPLNPRAPINIEVFETGTWIHGVRFSWRYRTDTEWRTVEKTCDRWGQDPSMPVSVNATDEVGFGWPGPLPPRQAAIIWKVDVDWGLSRQPPTRRFEGLEGSTTWQA